MRGTNVQGDWSGASGIWTGQLNPSSGDCGVTPRLVARGGSQPDWSRG